MLRKLLDTLTWMGVWASFALGFVVILISAFIVNLKDPAFVGLLVFAAAIVMIAYWMATGFPEPWRVMH